MAGSYTSRSRNNIRPLLTIPAWSCHTSQCRLLSKSFNLAHNSSGSPSASGSLRQRSLSLSSSELSQLYSLYVLTLMYFSFFNTLFSLISDKRYFLAVSFQRCFSIFPSIVITSLTYSVSKTGMPRLNWPAPIFSIISFLILLLARLTCMEISSSCCFFFALRILGPVYNK